jgi:hypothetical protein
LKLIIPIFYSVKLMITVGPDYLQLHQSTAVTGFMLCLYHHVAYVSMTKQSEQLLAFGWARTSAFHTFAHAVRWLMLQVATLYLANVALGVLYVITT